MENFSLLFKISELIAKQKTGDISDDEKLFLENWLNTNKKNREIYDDLQENFDINKEINQLKSFNAKKAFKAISKQTGMTKTRVIKLSNNIYKYAAAVAVLVVCFFAINRFFNYNEPKQIAITEIKPGTQKAILTTSTNEKIELGQTEKKRIFNFEKATVIDTSETLTYQNKEDKHEEEIEIAYNQLETPRGGEYKLILSDGTKVFLNAETKLKFPESFIGEVREVQLEGEAYFDVAKSYVPFKVKVNGMKVKVYGTSFNISGYKDDEFIQTTLIEGKVGVEVTSEDEKIEYEMAPGQQANYVKTTTAVELKKVNTEIYTAWTKGMFVFENEALEYILDKLTRWYDIEFEFENDILKSEPFTGDLKKYENINKILEMISMASNIEFKLDNNKIKVMEKEN